MSKSFPTFKFVQKDFLKKDGTKNIFIRLTINRKIKYLPLGIYVQPKHFKKSLVLKGDANHKEKNALLGHYEIKAKQILFDYRINDKQISFEQFEKEFYNNTYGSDSFYDFFENQIKLLKPKLSINTIKAYKSQLGKLREFKQNVTFNDIDINFITGYEGFIKQKKGNNQNTVSKSIKFIKSILNKAVEQGIIKENPIKGYKIFGIHGNRQYLTLNELESLEAFYSNNVLATNKANVLRYFLFCCYTGLRYQDIKQLRFKDIKDSNIITIQMIKTKEYVNIPLIDKAKKLVPEKGFYNQNVFKVMTSQPTNRYLKEIMKQAGINKQISFHCARHTFATVSKSLGIPYDVISKILGHTDIKTTKIYTRYEMKVLTDEMQKWNEK